MRRRPLIIRRVAALAAAGLALPGALTGRPARASDHNNIDAGRPLRFDDAETVAFGERTLEFGAELGAGRGRAAGLGLTAEYLVGFALNTQVSLDLDPSVGGRSGTRDTRFDIGNVGVGVLHNFNREYDGTPAFSLRGDLFLPTGRGARGVDVRLRAIASKTVRQYGRLHLNVDAEMATRPEHDERSFRPGLIVGYSRPLGYPTRFDRTGLAELAVRSGEAHGEGAVISAGVGVRQQVGVRSVADAGLRSDIAGFRGASRENLRIVAGYSTSF